MIESFIGKNRSLPYGMAISELLVKDVGNLDSERKTYLTSFQHINGNTAIRIGYHKVRENWVKTEKAENNEKKKRKTSKGLSVESLDEIVVLGLATLKMDMVRLDHSFLEFREEVRADLQSLHHQQ